MGPPIRSPNSQRYVVQHNSSPGGVGSHSTGGGGSKGRLLPYPPIVGEAELFHPRPRMGMGVVGLAGGLEDGLDEGDETVYHSALEIQTESADSDEEGSATSPKKILASGNETENGNATEGADLSEKAKEAREGEEPTVQDLLPLQSQTRPRTISGPEAWEMELGEIVKRIDSSGSSATTPAPAASGSIIPSVGGTRTRTRPKKRELMMSEIKRMGEVDGLSEGGSKKKMMMISGGGGVLDPELFETSDLAVSSAKGGDAVDGQASVPLPDSASSRSALDERESSIAERESTITKRESTIAERESTVTEREISIAEREKSITERESTIAEQESAVTERESSFTERESTITERESTVTERESSITERESTIIVLESSLNVRESSIAELESLITERESSVTDRESSLDIRESSIVSRKSTISERESAITARESALTTHKFAIKRQMGDIQQREVEVEKRESEVEKREQEVERREVEVKEWYQRKLNEIESRVLVDVPPSISVAAPASTCTCAGTLKWPPSPMEYARRLCATYLLPVLGKERTPGFLLPTSDNGAGAPFNSPTITSASTSMTETTTTTTKTKTKTFSVLPYWSFKREFFLNRLWGATVGGGSFIVLVSIGICVILLRGFIRRVLRVGGFWRR